MKVYNKSKERSESAIIIECPRCKGGGHPREDNWETCTFCRGYGDLWSSVTGWLRAKYARQEESFLY